MDGQTQTNRHQHRDFDVGFTFGVAEGGTFWSGLPFFSYLWAKHNLSLELDPNYMEIDHGRLKKHKWVEFYGELKEAIPTDIKDPRGKSVDLGMNVDSNHAG